MKNAAYPRLFWVESDPDRERAADPLGLSAQADRIADRLLPGLSVNTQRIRYLSFFCWAVQKVRGERNPLTAIHRLEALLACDEYRTHLGDHTSNCPSIVGITRARDYLENNDGRIPTRPEALYKNTAFAAYRPLMLQLGLITGRRRPNVTEEGARLARMFQKACGSKRKCLSEIHSSNEERRSLRKLLGLDLRLSVAKLPDPARRRRATYLELASELNAGTPPNAILECYATVLRNRSEAANTLHRAFVWETLSLGLTLAFALLLRETSVSIVAKRLRKAMVMHARWPGLRRLDPINNDSPLQIRGLLRRACEFDPVLLNLDDVPFILARTLVIDKDTDAFLLGVLEHHCQTKVGDPWFHLKNGKIHILATKKNLDLVPRPRTYRIDAFAQLLRDLGNIS